MIPIDSIELVKKEVLRRGYSPRTAKTYAESLKSFFRFCHKEPRKITKKDFLEYKDMLIEKGYAASTINLRSNALKFLLHEILGKNTLIKVHCSKRPKVLPSYLSKEEAVDLINAIPNPKHKLMIKLIYSAGLRLNELINLRVGDLEFGFYGWIRKGKGNKDRQFIIAKSLVDELKEHIRSEGLSYDSILFQGRFGKYHPRTIQEIVKKAKIKAGIMKNAHPLTLRHSFATHLFEDGCDQRDIQMLLGHKSMQTTDIYIHMASRRTINIASPLDKLAI